MSQGRFRDGLFLFQRGINPIAKVTFKKIGGLGGGSPANFSQDALLLKLVQVAVDRHGAHLEHLNQILNVDRCIAQDHFSNLILTLGL